MNKLHEKFAKQGLTIIGVSDESVAKVEPYIQQNNVQYVIAIGGAAGYTTGSIPHAWLVSPSQEIVWHGLPAELKESLIEEHIKKVRLAPTFEFPKELKSVEKILNAGNYGKGLKELESHLKSAKSDGVRKAAEEALEKVKAYGKGKLEAAEACAGEGYYAEAIESAEFLEKSFKDHELSEQAKAKKEAWKKDPKVKAELEASANLDRAQGLIRDKKYKPAGAILQQLISNKKFSETKARKRAEEKLKAIKSYL